MTIIYMPGHAGQKFETRFLLYAHSYFASGTTTSGTKANPKSDN